MGGPPPRPELRPTTSIRSRSPRHSPSPSHSSRHVRPFTSLPAFTVGHTLLHRSLSQRALDAPPRAAKADARPCSLTLLTARRPFRTTNTNCDGQHASFHARDRLRRPRQAPRSAPPPRALAPPSSRYALPASAHRWRRVPARPLPRNRTPAETRRAPDRAPAPARAERPQPAPAPAPSPASRRAGAPPDGRGRPVAAPGWRGRGGWGALEVDLDLGAVDLAPVKVANRGVGVLGVGVRDERSPFVRADCEPDKGRERRSACEPARAGRGAERGAGTNACG